MRRERDTGKRGKVRKEKAGIRKLLGISLLFAALFFPVMTGRAADTEDDLQREYMAYQERFASIERLEDLEEYGYEVMEEQVFPVTLDSIRAEELTMVPAVDRTCQRLALFFLDGEGQVVYRYNQLEANYRISGELRQTVKDVTGVAFSDVNGDGLKDIILISRCENPTGNYAGIPYKVGDVIFQENGQL